MINRALEGQLTGGEIKSLRKAAGLSQCALASMMGVNLNTVSRWENFKAFPTIEHCVMLRMVFDGTWHYDVEKAADAQEQKRAKLRESQRR